MLLLRTTIEGVIATIIINIAQMLSVRGDFIFLEDTSPLRPKPKTQCFKTESPSRNHLKHIAS